MTTERRPPDDKETWWWNDKVQEVITAKTEARIEDAGNIRRQEDRGSYRQANKAVKKSVATAKARAMKVLYEELETPEGERNIYISDSESPRQND